MKRKNTTVVLKQPLAKTINRDMPLKLKDLEGVLAKVSDKYPLLPKEDVVLIVKTFLEEMRSELLQGNKIFIKDFVHQMDLFSFVKSVDGKMEYSIRLRTLTPKAFR